MDSTFEPKIIFCLILGIILSIWIYIPGLGGSFEFDDYGAIANNGYLKISHFTFEDLWQASLSTDTGPLKRPVAMFSFAVNHVFTGMDPWWMKLTNLSIHLINGLLVLLVVRRLFHQFYDRNRTDLSLIPYFIAGLWLVHPINVTAVSYIVQRMTSLSATFVLLAIYCYLKLREGKLLDWRGYVLSLSMLIFWLLGMLSKETAILLSIYIFVIEWCVYGFQTDSIGKKRYLRILWSLLAVPWVCAFIYAIYEPSFIRAGYEYRDYTMIERVLTEFRIVVDYLRLIIIPDTRHLGLYHDDIIYSKSLIEPISTLLSMLMIIGLMVLAIRVRKKSPLFCLGVFWFLGGHVLESTIYPLELMFLHRNYLPSIGILLAVTDIGVRLYQRNRVIMTVAAVSILLGFSVSTRSLAYQWSDDFRMLILEAMNNPKSVRANFSAGHTIKVYVLHTAPGKQRDEYKRMAIEYFNKIKKLDHRNTLGEMSILETYLLMKEVPPQSIIENLILDLPAAKLDLGTTGILKSYLVCLTSGSCPLKSEDFDRIVQALLSNQELNGYQRHKLLIVYAEYLADYQDNIKSAIAIAVDALVEHTTLKGFMLLSLYYEKGGYMKEMKRNVDMLERTDKFGRYRRFIRESRERMNSQFNTQ